MFDIFKELKLAERHIRHIQTLIILIDFTDDKFVDGANIDYECVI